MRHLSDGGRLRGSCEPAKRSVANATLRLKLCLGVGMFLTMDHMAGVGIASLFLQLGR